MLVADAGVAHFGLVLLAHAQPIAVDEGLGAGRGAQHVHHRVTHAHIQGVVV